jgi:hypothetical protein
LKIIETLFLDNKKAFAPPLQRLILQSHDMTEAIS